MKSEKLEAVLGVGIVILVLSAALMPMFGVLGGLALIVWVASEMKR